MPITIGSTGYITYDTSWPNRTLEWHTEDPAQCQLRDSTQQEWCAILKGCILYLKSKACTSYCVSSWKTLGFRNSGVGAAVAPLTIMPNDPLGEFVPSIPTTLGSAKLEVLHPKGGTPVPENTARVPLNYKLRVQPKYFGFLFLEISRQEEETLPLSRSNWSLSLGGGRTALT